MLRHWTTWVITSAVSLAITLALALLGCAQCLGAASGPDPLLVDDFEDGDFVAASGSAWIGLADDLFGGKSTVELTAVKGGAHGSRGALRIHGTVSGSPGSIVSAWTPVLEGARAADLGRFEGIRMMIRGTGDVLIGIHGGPNAKLTNFMERATARARWSTVTVLFKDLAPQGKGRENEAWSPHEARYVGVSSAPGASGDFDVTIDDVSWIGPKGSARPPAEPGTTRFTRALVPDDAAPLHDLPWRELARDDAGDGRPGLPDGRALFVAKDPGRPLVWFRIDLESPVPAHWIGVNLVLDEDGDPANGPAWWGKNNAFHFDRLVTAWVFPVGNRYEGSVGIVPADEAAAFRVTNDRDTSRSTERRSGSTWRCRRPSSRACGRVSSQRWARPWSTRTICRTRARSSSAPRSPGIRSTVPRTRVVPERGLPPRTPPNRTPSAPLAVSPSPPARGSNTLRSERGSSPRRS